MIYADKTINKRIGYKDTNINVFTFGFVPLNDVFDYTGIAGFFDKKSSVSTNFTKSPAVSSSNNFTDETTNE